MYIMFLFKNFYPKFTFFILKIDYSIAYYNKYSKYPVRKWISISIYIFLTKNIYVKINNLQCTIDNYKLQIAVYILKEIKVEFNETPPY